MYTTILQDSTLDRLAKIVKLLKSDFIYVTESGNIYGFNKDFTVIRTSNIIEYDLPVCIFRTLDFNAFIKAKCESIIMKFGCRSELIPFNFGDKSDPEFLYSGMYLKNSLDNMIYHKDYILSEHDILCANYEFQNDPEFRFVYDGPSTKGASLLPSYGIYIYKGLIPIASKDQLAFTLYNDIDRVMAEFTVTKPKGVMLTTYICYIRLEKVTISARD